MIWLAWLAWAGAQDAEALRLLGPATAPSAVAEAPPSPMSSFGPWPVALGGLGLVALWWGRGKFRLGGLRAEPELKIVSRTTLGGRAGLAVIEVRAAEGAWRRLVIGTGDGAPRLVADLGITSFEEALAAEDPLAAPASMPTPVPVAIHAAVPVLPATQAPMAEATPSLVDEVLGERKRRQSSFRTVG